MTYLINRILLKGILAGLATCLVTLLFAQDNAKNETTLYTFVFNQVPPGFKFPVVGLINMAEGDQQGIQVGLTNFNQKDLGGVQAGFTNAAGGGIKGVQVGFVNACRDALDGVQVGYINVTGRKTDGGQVGFVNACRDSLDGAQVGFVNITGRKADGTQVGFVNGCKDSLHGLQAGFVNFTGKKTDGAQIGFVNACNGSFNGGAAGFVNVATDEVGGAQAGFINFTRKALMGTQIGFINIADSISRGIPVGFISVVRKGGYRSLELGYSELYPVNLTGRIGVKQLYTIIGISYNPDFTNSFAGGLGLGSSFVLSKSFFFNPEAIMQRSIETKQQYFLSLTTQFVYVCSDKFSIAAGPAVTWSYKDKNSPEALYRPSFSLYENKIDQQNHLHVGARLALRYQLN